MFGWLFGGSKAADKTVDSLSKGFDKLVYTDEEKSDARQKGVELFIEYQRATLPQNRARRLIAVMLTALFCFMVICTVAVWKIDKDYAQFILQVLSDTLVTPFGLIIAFYFVKHLIPGQQR